MTDLKFDNDTIELASEVGFTCSIEELTEPMYTVRGHGIVCRNIDQRCVYTFLYGYKLGKESYYFTEEWSARDMG